MPDPSPARARLDASPIGRAAEGFTRAADGLTRAHWTFWAAVFAPASAVWVSILMTNAQHHRWLGFACLAVLYPAGILNSVRTLRASRREK